MTTRDPHDPHGSLYDRPLVETKGIRCDVERLVDALTKERESLVEELATLEQSEAKAKAEVDRIRNAFVPQ